MTQQIDFQPQWMSPPGETIRDILEQQSLTVSWLTDVMNYSPKKMNDLLIGEISINKTMAEKLSEALGPSAKFWLDRDSMYQSKLKDAKEQDSEWISRVPVNEMVANTWIEKPKNESDKVKVILDFFGISEKSMWNGIYEPVRSDYAFRTSLSYESNPVGVSVWLRQAEISAQRILCEVWNQKGFRDSLNEARKLIREKNPQTFIPKLQGICAENGVALVVLPSVKGCRASGATRFLSNEKAVIVMSARYLSDDHFWFTFFHECGHLILHKDKKFTLDFNNSPLDSENPQLELEANQFAEDILIPTEHKDLLKTVKHSRNEIIRLSTRIGVSPGVTVGQMQNKRILKRNWLNFLKRRYKWKDSVLVLV